MIESFEQSQSLGAPASFTWADLSRSLGLGQGGSQQKNLGQRLTQYGIDALKQNPGTMRGGQNLSGLQFPQGVNDPQQGNIFQIPTPNLHPPKQEKETGIGELLSLAALLFIL